MDNYKLSEEQHELYLRSILWTELQIPPSDAGSALSGICNAARKIIEFAIQFSIS
ncbi:MAG: hypothetical protein K0B15_17040 [Lentimicrobium sp.]|nr:hypothetical protein [Lentimicrobium sp.]